MYKKPKYSKPISYSTIGNYDSYQDENLIQEPQIHIGVPLVFQSVGKVPPVINEVKDDQVKQSQNRYKTFIDYGTF